jgi:KaiC/GvpD/RAD55 family RecA-like ATPase
MKRELVKSGIPGLDKLLGGGFLEGSVVTLSGPTGCGKSTFAMQYLVEGIQKYKEPGVYIAIEETRESTYFHMSGYSWDLEKMEKARQLVFLDYPVYEVDQFMNQYSAIQEIINAVGAKRVVIDSVMPIALYFHNDDDRKKGFLKLIDNIRKWGTTTLIVSEDTAATTNDVLPETKYGIETFTEGWVHIYYMFSAKTQERTRAIEVLKMKGVAHSTKIFPARVDRNGFSVMVK